MLSTLIKVNVFLVKSNCTNFCNEYEKILELLIDENADVNAVDRDGRTALDTAVEANESEGKHSELVVRSYFMTN